MTTVTYTDQELEKAFNKAKLGLFRVKHSAFLMAIYCGLKFSWNTGIPTACVTATKQLLINADWFMSLTERSRVSLLAHELWHVAFMHFLRVGPRDPRIWNMACDHAINLMLLDQGYQFDMPGLWDPQYKGMSAEQIYDSLIANAVPVYLPFGDDIDTTAPEETTREIDLPRAIADFTALVVRAQTVEAMSSTAGKLPGTFTEMMDELLRPVLPWEVLLQRWLTARSEIESTWRRPNRRHSTIYLPSRGGETGLQHIMWAIDSSGSMTTQQLRKINSEMKGAYELYQPEEMTVLVFDTVIQDRLEFGSGRSLEKLHIRGRGGTDLDCVWEVAQRERPDALIVMSDMECHIPPQIAGVETLWVCLDNPSWQAPYGDVVHLDSRAPTTA